LVDFDYITLQTNDKHLLQDEIVRPMTYRNATIGVYSAAYDPVLKKMGPYRLKEYTNMNVKVARPQGDWVITVCEPDEDGHKSTEETEETANFCATVGRGDKGHYTDKGTLVFKDGLHWVGLEAVKTKEKDTLLSRNQDKAQGQDWNEKVGRNGRAEALFATRKSEEGEASSTGEDTGSHDGDEKTAGPSTKTRATPNWVQWFGGRPSNKRPPRSTKRQ
jgi:hypothetical protein